MRTPSIIEAAVTTRVLSFHAGYQCHNSGHCCTAGWPIPVEVDRLTAAQAAIASGHLRARGGAGAFTFPADAPSDTPALVGQIDTTCVFRDRRTRRCRLQATLGHDALPLACRQFPRVSVLDPLATSISLSHYCPTAARLLESDAPVTIVHNSTRFPADGEYHGLDARTSLPPLLCPDVLMTWDAWHAWEAHSVTWLTTRADSARTAVASLAAIVEDVRRWRPGPEPLLDRIARAFRDASADAPSDVADWASVDRQHVREVFEAVPEDLRPEAGRHPKGSVESDAGKRRFLAAHAFASWSAHLGRGLRTWLRSLEAALAILEWEGTARDADLLLRHLADPNTLARLWSRAESGPPRN